MYKRVLLFILIIILISCSFMNTRPGAPGIVSYPLYAIIDSTVTVTLYTIDNDGDSVRFQIDWGNGTTSDWTSYVASSEYANIEYAYAEIGTFYFKAVAQDIDGRLSSWTNEKMIIVDSIEHSDTLNIKWQLNITDLIGNGYNLNSKTPAIGSDSTIYIIASPNTAGGGSYLLAINNNGIEKWRYVISNDNCNNPIVYNNYIIVSGLGIKCFLNDGTLNWEYANTDTCSNAIVDDNGNIYSLFTISSSEKILKAIDISGTLLWESDTLGIGNEWIGGSNGNIYVLIEGDSLYKFDTNGNKNWSMYVPDSLGGPFCIDESNNLYVTWGSDSVYCISDSATVKWKYGNLGGIEEHLSEPTVSDNIYLYVQGVGLQAISKNGGQLWSYTENIVNNSVCNTVSDNYCICLGLGDGFYIFDNMGSIINKNLSIIPYGSIAINDNGDIIALNEQTIMCLESTLSPGSNALYWYRKNKNNQNTSY